MNTWFARAGIFALLYMLCIPAHGQPSSPEMAFLHPPEGAKPGVLWMWMGSNLSKEGITRDLEALKEEGFNRTTMFSLADVTTPWAGEIGKSPTPELISWTEPWWKLVRYAAEESRRLQMDFGMFNGPGYESSGGPWITPKLSMQEICWSLQPVKGGSTIMLNLARPQVDPHANQPYPVFNPETGLVEKPVIPARSTFYKDIAVLALPAQGIVPIDSIIDLTNRMQTDGQIAWNAPAGDWIVYRFGHTTMGTLIQPAQWKATGLECDKMSQEAVDFHMDHIIGEIQRHLGDLIGNGFTHVHFDSYEAGYPTWTPKMREEFLHRRGYELTPWLATFAGRTINSAQDSLRFQTDYDATIKDLYRDIYYATIAKRLKAAHLIFLCEPYGGPWRQDEIMPLVQHVMTEFWTHGGTYSPYELDPTVAALRKSGQNIVEAEAFTGDPHDSKWDETPSWLKPMGDAAFCAGVNRFVLHRFVQQPWNIRYQPGATMGQWGTHFDRTQTWWKPAKAMVKYWQRCQALLQWGRIAPGRDDDFTVSAIRHSTPLAGNSSIKAIHRSQDGTDIYFVANLSHDSIAATCSFKITGMQPELWDPVTGSMRPLPQFEDRSDKISLSLSFQDAQSFFIVFRRKRVGSGTERKANFTSRKEVLSIDGAWRVKFDNTWGGPAGFVTFASLQDWTTRPETGIRYFSGTAVYQKSFDLSSACLSAAGSGLYVDLGSVKHVAHVFLNDKDLGILWTAPWSIRIPAGLLKAKGNRLVIDVTNVWANRLIGDEQEPADCEWLPGHMGGGRFLKAFPDWFLKNTPRPSKARYCFTTWNYFTRDSPLVSSGLLGPVKIMKEL
jgi:alpha-L-rhamnosidase